MRSLRSGPMVPAGSGSSRAGRLPVQAEELAAGQREREWFRALTIPPGMWVIIRADGRGFSRLTEEHFAKPFDERMREHMTVAAEALMTEFGAAYGCTHSDEI